jgi:hypothetical protein
VEHYLGCSGRTRRKYDLRVWNASESSQATCTLLGPEGPTPEYRGRPSDLVTPAEMARVTRYRPSFENYTVDASILEREFIHVLDI